MQTAPRKNRRSLRSAALLGAALLMLPTAPATAQSVPLSGVWSGIAEMPLIAASMELKMPDTGLERLEDVPLPRPDAVAPLFAIDPLPEEWHAPTRFTLVEERSGGLGMGWTMNRRWSVGLTYRRGFENVQLDPTAEIPRGTLGGLPVDDRLATQSLMLEFRLNF
jgi:hypothetical protein